MSLRKLDNAVSRYSFDSGDPLFPVQVERVGRRGAGLDDFDAWADVWAVRWKNWCLDCDGTWIHEPLPSSRDNAFLSQTRWTREEAIERAAVAAALLQTMAATPRPECKHG